MKCTDKKCVRCFYSKKVRNFKREDFLTDQEIKIWWNKVKDRPFLIQSFENISDILKECL